jgi:hypothetical protein
LKRRYGDAIARGDDEFASLLRLVLDITINGAAPR